MPGYCSHDSILFPMWHRPYLLLFEQMVWGYAKEIAAQYPTADLARYQRAAATLRIPYWDWSLNSTMPDVATADQLTVNTPQGPQTITNPLKGYDFHPFNASEFGSDMPKFNYTVRTPNAAGQSQIDYINGDLRQYSTLLHNEVYKLLTSVAEYQPFSNTKANSTMSIEAIHGYIHNWVGGLQPNIIGHMTLFPYSAFDPIFMLHHCNVDRLIAIWQALHPNTFVVPQASGSDTYMAAAGTIEDADTPLYPFHSDDQGTFHTSNSVRYLKNLGYSYMEVFDWAYPSPDALAEQVRTNVNSLYHPRTNNAVPISSSWPASLRHGDSATANRGAALATDHEWTLRLTLRGSLPHAASFILHAPDSTKLISTIIDTNTSSPFATFQSTVPLTSAILSTGSDSKSLDPEAALDFVKSVKWEAAGINPALPGNGSAKVPSLTATLLVELLGRTISQPTRVDEFPKYGEWTEHGRLKLAEDGRLVLA